MLPSSPSTNNQRREHKRKHMSGKRIYNSLSFSVLFDLIFFSTFFVFTSLYSNKIEIMIMKNKMMMMNIKSRGKVKKRIKLLKLPFTYFFFIFMLLWWFYDFLFYLFLPFFLLSSSSYCLLILFYVYFFSHFIWFSLFFRLVSAGIFIFLKIAMNTFSTTTTYLSILSRDYIYYANHYIFDLSLFFFKS